MTRFARDSQATELRKFLEAIAGYSDADADVEFAPVSKADELRYTFGPMYPPGVLDAHDEFATDEDLRKAVWEFSLNGDRTLRKQHGPRKAGDIVEIVRWPFEHEAELSAPGQPVRKVKFPANTVYTGVVWTPETWNEVKKGAITGFSMGGAAVRMRGLPTDGLVRL